MDPIKGLVQIGLTEYEAKVYLALLKQPETSGYEVSRLSGVPRSKVYETLEGLVRKGAATSLTLDGKQIYQALPHELLLSRYQQQTNRVLGELSSSLAQASAEQPHSALTNLSGYDPVIERVREMCRQARVRLLIAGLPAELEQITPELVSAQERGVKIFVLSYGPCDIPIENLFIHSVTHLQYLQVAVIGRWLGVVSDFREAMLVTAGAETIGIWGSNKGLVYALSLWIQHDISIAEYAKHLGPEIIEKVPKHVLNTLRQLVLIEPEELPGREEGEESDSAGNMLREIAQRIDNNPLAYQSALGEYGIELRGRSGGVFTINVNANGSTLSKGLHSPDLMLSMDALDFVSLVRGTLPIMAFMERGRITVSGDLGLAGHLQLILRG